MVVLGCQRGAFLEPKIDQHATYEFLIFIDFAFVFPLLLRLGRVLCWFSIGSFFASFLALIFGRFWGRFGSHFGRLWGVQIGHFGHRFLDDFWIEIPRAHMHVHVGRVHACVAPCVCACVAPCACMCGRVCVCKGSQDAPRAPQDPQNGPK